MLGENRAVWPSHIRRWSVISSPFGSSDLGALRRYKSLMWHGHTARFAPSTASLTLTAKWGTYCGVVQKHLFSGNTGVAIPPSKVRDFSHNGELTGGFFRPDWVSLAEAAAAQTQAALANADVPGLSSTAWDFCPHAQELCYAKRFDGSGKTVANSGTRRQAGDAA